MGTCGRRFRRAFSPKSSVFFKEIGLRRMAVLVGRPNKTGGAVKPRGDWGGAAPPLVRERARAFAASPPSVSDKTAILRRLQRNCLAM